MAGRGRGIGERAANRSVNRMFTTMNAENGSAGGIRTAQESEQVSTPVLTRRVPILCRAADDPDVAVPDRSGHVAFVGLKDRYPQNVVSEPFEPDPQLCVQFRRIRNDAWIMFASQ